MPKELERCVKDVESQGKDKSSAYGICAKSTGWVRKKGGGWTNKKTGENFQESFLWIFTEGEQQTLKWLRDTKGIQKEIKRLKKVLLKATDEDTIEIIKAINYLQSKLKEL